MLQTFLQILRVFMVWKFSPEILEPLLFSSQTRQAGAQIFVGLPTWSSYYATNNGSITIYGYAGFDAAVKVPDKIRDFAVTCLGTNTFAYDNHINSVVIPSSVTNIEDESFYGCTNLKTFYFQGDPPSVGASVFYGITDAIVYFLPGHATNWDSTFAGFTAWALYPFNYTTNGGEITITGYTGNGGAITIPEIITGLPVKSLGDNAFENCYVTSIAIPNSVSSLGKYTFRYDSSLTNITIPTNVSLLESSVFQGCGLTDVALPENITSIGELAFAFCPLKHIVIPESVTNIGSYAFEHTDLTNITFPKSITSVGSDVFDGCTNLETAYFLGNAPNVGSLVFRGETGPPIYYLPNSIGWGTTFGGLPTRLWLPQAQVADATFGVRTNQFGFNINWASDQTVVVEACTNLISPDWQPVQTNVLTTGSAYFSDPQWTNYPGRFYRLRSP